MTTEVHRPCADSARIRWPFHDNRVFLAWVLLLAVVGLLGLFRGFADAGGFAFDWFAGYTDALNSWRVFKSLGFALLFAPLLRQAMAQGVRSAGQHLGLGVVSGLALVALATLWERAAFPGLLNFSAPYRTVALFWEMHVGGAAIDAYLVLATPFVVWALSASRRPVAWGMAALLALLVCHACLSRYSRGVYAAVLLSLGLLALLLRAQQRAAGSPSGAQAKPVWRARAERVLALALVVEVAGVLLGGSFMTQRLGSSEHDWGSRMAHWRHGVSLLRSPADWLLGLGLGRLPAHYAGTAGDGEFPGAVQWHAAVPGPDSRPFATLTGPRSVARLGGQFVLTQRVAAGPDEPHRARLTLRTSQSGALAVSLCERHLLYDGACQTVRFQLRGGPDSWQTLEQDLQGPVVAATGLLGRSLVFSVSVLDVGGAVDLAAVQLLGPQNQALLQNEHFALGLSQWLPSAKSYFLPWHIDNLFLELLIERGLSGLLLFVALSACALWHLVFGRARQQPLAPYLAAALCAALLLGLVSSVMDVPRVAFLELLLTLFALGLAAAAGPFAYSPSKAPAAESA